MSAHAGISSVYALCSCAAAFACKALRKSLVVAQKLWAEHAPSLHQKLLLKSSY